MKAVHDVVLRPKATTYTAKALLVQDLRIPIHIALGRYEAASQEELHDILADIQHELNRR